MDGPSGVFLVDKPAGPSSRTTLDAIERRLDVGPIGHTGTLDPLASGLLVVLVGKARRLQDLLMGSTKTYDAELTFGATSATLDGEGPITATETPVPSLPAVLQPALDGFVGEIEQIPPAHSAIHIKGRRAYELARRGEEPALKSRRVRIDAIELLATDRSRATIRVTSGPGTYIRSLAHDIGAAVGCGAYLSGLRRVRNGRFSVTDARSPDDVDVDDLLPLAEVLAPFARVDVDKATAVRLSLGQTVRDLHVPEDGPAFAWLDGEPVCRLRGRDEGGRSDLRLRAVVNDPE